MLKFRTLIDRFTFSKHLLTLLCASILHINVSEAAETESSPATQNLQEYLNTVTFIPPEGWKAADSKLLSPNVKALIIGPEGFYPPSINLATENYNGAFKDYLKIVRSIAEKKGSNWKDLGIFKTSAGDGRLTQLDTKSEWGDVRMLHLIVLKEGTIYILTAAALKSEFSKYYQNFFDSLRSLKIDSELHKQ